MARFESPATRFFWHKIRNRSTSPKLAVEAIGGVADQLAGGGERLQIALMLGNSDKRCFPGVIRRGGAMPHGAASWGGKLESV